MKTKLLLILLLFSLITSAQTNLVPNGGFENWTNTTTLSDWTTKNNVTQNTSFFIDGIKSVQLSITDNTIKPEILAQVPMQAGKTYTVKFKYKYVDTNFNGQHPISLNISKTGSATTLSSSTFATGNNWTVKETTFTPDQNLSYDLSISIATFDAATFNVLIDAVQVYEQGTEQYTLIPDVNFEKKLIDLGLDDVEDAKVLTSNINTLTALNVSSSSISDLTGIEDFILLSDLNCSTNKLTNLDLSENVNLKSLKANKNILTNVDITKNLLLTYLDFQSNKLASIDISNNSLLKHFNCSSNNLISEDVSKNTLLTDFYCHNNQITNLDISKNIALDFFMCHYNKLKTIDVSNNPELTIFDCLFNEITSIDISKNPKIYEIACENNQLTYLNLKNGNNVNFDKQFSNFVNNPNLTCIQVDDAIYSNANWATKKDVTASYNDVCIRYTLIPDANFEKRLISLGIDTGDIDGKVLTANISSITKLDLYNSSIENLTGIQDFTSLSDLNCSSNKLTEVDLSQNFNLKVLNLSYNKLATIDISKYSALENLSIFNNYLTNLDTSQNTNLQYLSCASNQLTSLDLSKNKKLSSVWCSSNQLTNLDLSQNTSLNSVTCSDNKLSSLNLKNGNNTSITSTSIDLKKNPLLNCIVVDNALYSNANWSEYKDKTAGFSSFDCSLITAIPDIKFEEQLIALGIDNDGKNGVVLNSSIVIITSLNVSSSLIKDLTGIKGFVALTNLNCSDNLLNDLDLGKNSLLTSLDCSNNSNLASLNLKNGNNTSFINSSLNFTNNPTLLCIQVDNVDYSNSNWTDKKDVTTNYNLDCTIYTLIPDSNFEQKLIDLGIDKDGLNGKIATEDIAKITSLDLSNSNISNLSGIEYFTALTYLDCNYNNIQTIDVSQNKSLTKLALHDNKLTHLDISANKELFNLTFSKNQISTIDLSQNKKLHYVVADQNLLTSIDFSANPELEMIYCGNNSLTTLNVSNLPNLLDLNCTNTNISVLDVNSNPKLNMLYFNNAKLTTLNLSNNPLLKNLNVSWNQLTTLDLSNNPLLELVFIEFNPLTSLNVQNGNNKNFKLYKTTGKNAETQEYTSFLNNSNLRCIKVDDVAYSNTHWTNIKDATATFNIECTGELTLPSNNFTVETKGESCLGENNGEINIKATETFSYTASIGGKNYPFTNNNLAITKLLPGTYPISITIPGEIFEQNFTVVIAKGATITGKSSIASKKVNIEITEGTAPYTVFVNGIEQFESNTSSFSITAKGGGLLEVKTAKACEGIYSEDIAGLDLVVAAYPNPTSGYFEIELPTSNKEEVTIEINTLEGRIISSKNYTLENGTAKLTLENQPKGVYIAKIYLDTIKNVKIIKN